MLIVNPSLHQETPSNKAIAPLEDDAINKTNGCETDSFSFSQCRQVCYFIVKDVDDFYHVFTVNDHDEIDLDKEAVDPPLS